MAKKSNSSKFVRCEQCGASVSVFNLERHIIRAHTEEIMQKVEDDVMNISEIGSSTVNVHNIVKTDDEHE